MYTDHQHPVIKLPTIEEHLRGEQETTAAHPFFDTKHLSRDPRSQPDELPQAISVGSF